MKVLTVYAHPNPNSFSHALLEEFTRGLADASHEGDVLDLYALKFDPVFTQADMATGLDPPIPPDILEAMNPRQRVLDGARGPIQRFRARRLVRGKDKREIARFLRDHGPEDAARHWQHVAGADALAFIAPVFWLRFPAILKGWHERVFSFGNAFALDRSGWEGQVSGRVDLLKHRRALLMMSTLFSREDYDAEWVAPMRRVLGDWSLQYPGIERDLAPVPSELSPA
jgi:NAD(P)H dehydrogenase (quinone)